MLIHAILPASRANGPGLRAVLWTQGCALRCAGCWNPETWQPRAYRMDLTPPAAADRLIRCATPETQGVTISGGEPLHQAYHLLELVCHILQRRPRWTIGLFSGYTEAEFEAGNYLIIESKVDRSTRAHLWVRLRRYLDFAVLGRYDRTAGPSTEPLCSTANQHLYLYSNRYQLSDFETLVETTIHHDGLTQITGFPISSNLAEERKDT